MAPKLKTLSTEELRVMRWRLLSYEPKTIFEIKSNKLKLVKVSVLLFERTQNPIYLLGINGD